MDFKKKLNQIDSTPFRRRIVVGDLHGNWKGLDRLLHDTGYQPGADILIFVGDINDHPPGTGGSVRHLVDHLLALREADPDIVFVRGNHDQWFAEWLAGSGPPELGWLWQGGIATLKSYGITGEENRWDRAQVPPHHQAFITSVPVPYYCDGELVVVHAGFRTWEQLAAVAAGGPIAPGDLHDLIWDRHFIFAEDAETQAQFEKALGYRYLVTGHCPRGPWVNPRNRKWLLVDSPGKGSQLCAAVITGPDRYEFRCVTSTNDPIPTRHRAPSVPLI